jgi:cell wall-associated NlpC family hydrolase
VLELKLPNTAGLYGVKMIDDLINYLSIDRRITLVEIEIKVENDCVILSGLVDNKEIKNKIITFYRIKFNKSITDNIDVMTTSKRKGIIHVSVANLHKVPVLSSPLVTQALMGTEVSIMQSKGDWLQVKLSDGYLGWVSETVNELTDKSLQLWNNGEKIIITTMHNWIYSEPDTDSDIVSDTVIGNLFTLIGEHDSFYQILYPDNRTGYVKNDFCKLHREWLANIETSGTAIVKTAQMFTGIPYLWGGTSSKAVDCSGFVKMVYLLHGIDLPRDADQQAKIGSIVDFESDFSKVKPGDLLFFGRRKSDEKEIPITHVGLSLGGKKYMQASGDVHVSSFDSKDKEFDKRRSESLLQVRRILN